MKKLKQTAPEEEPEFYPDGDEPTIYRRRRFRWKPVLKWGSLALAALLLVLFILGYAWVKSKESNMRLQDVAGALDKKQKGRPVTTLVMGVDRGSVEGETGPGRSDIMMLVSVSSDGKKSAVISIPRDARVAIPGRRGYDKINAAHAYGGAELAIETVREFTGLDINHFVEIDFEGFKHIVNAIGGVPMHVDKAINDKYAGDVPAGDVVLSGDQALALVRARHDRSAVPAGDLDRVQNQRKFVQAMLQAVSRQRNPFRIKRLIEAASENIKTDLTFTDMLLLGRKLQGAGPDGMVMATAPGQPKVIGGTWYYIVDTEEFEELLSTFRSAVGVTEDGGSTPTADSPARSSVRVKVLNGTGAAGLASTVSKELEQKGYAVASSGNAKSAYEETTLYYAEGESAGAGMVAEDMGGAEEPVMKSNSSITGGHGVDVLVVLGADYPKP